MTWQIEAVAIAGWLLVLFAMERGLHAIWHQVRLDRTIDRMKAANRAGGGNRQQRRAQAAQRRKGRGQ